MNRREAMRLALEAPGLYAALAMDRPADLGAFADCDLSALVESAPYMSPGAFAVLASRGTWKMAAHHAVMDLALTKVADGEIKRLIVEMPPRHGKSELCSRYFPAWAMMRRPFTNMIVTGATADLANEFSQKSRELVQEYGVGMFNTTIAGGRKRLSDWALTNGSRARAAGVGGNIMGRGADIFIIDDYFKNADSALSELQRRKLMSWYLSTAQTRLSPDGAVVIIATRWHPDDLIGRLLRLESQGGDKWTRIRFPAIAEPGDPLGRAEGEALWPDQWPLQHLEDKRQAFMLGGHPWMWDALYQQKPPATLDATWEPELFEGDDIWFTEWPDSRDVQFRVAALDPSLGESEKSDYSAIVYGAVTNDGYIYVGANIGRRDPFKIVEASIDVCRMFGPNAFAVESNQYQKFLAQYFQKAVFEAGLLNPVVCINNTKEKTGRIKAGLSHLLRSRRIKFRSRTPGVALLMEQLRGFPGTEHDDGPDALEMMVRLATMIHSGQLPK